MTLPKKSTVAKPSSPTLLKTAGLIAAVTIFSKLIGFFRDWGMMVVYGTSLTTDAYYAAFQLPSFAIVLLGGLGGPFHTATVSVFSRFIDGASEPTEQTKQLVSTFLTLTSLVFVVLSVATYLFATPLMGLILQGAPPSLINLAAEQLKIMSPCILAGGVVGIFYGISNLYNGFLWPSLSPTALSLSILASLFFVNDKTNPNMLAWATLIGCFLQVAIQIPEFLKHRFKLRPALQWQHPDIKKAAEILFPAVIGTTIGQLITYVDMFFAAGLGIGGWSAVTLSNRLVQLPLGVLQTALLVPIFPRFSRAAAEGNVSDIKHHFKTGVVSLWLVSIPLLVVLALFTEPLIRLVFEHGKFNAEATRLVSLAVVYQAFQIIPYFARDSITRIFYAYQDAKTPLVVGLFAIVLKALLNTLLVPTFGVSGITFAITLVTFFNMVLLGVLSKRHIRDLGFKEMLLPFGKLVLAGLAMGATAYGVNGWLFSALSLQLLLPASVSLYASIGLASLAGLLVYYGMVSLLKIDEFTYIQKRLFSRFLRKGSS